MICRRVTRASFPEAEFLKHLGAIREVRDALVVQDTPSLTSLRCLPNLASIGGQRLHQGRWVGFQTGKPHIEVFQHDFR